MNRVFATQGGAGATVDPRVSRTRIGVIRAATDLLVAGGPNAVTIDAIVARSGIAKSTIYRHWESRDQVLCAVFEACAPELPEPHPDTDVSTSLHEVLRAMAGFLNDPEWARMVPALLLLKHHEAAIADLDQRVEHQQQKVVSTLLARGVADGVLAADLNIPEAITRLLGPLLFAHLTGSVKVDAAFADRTVDHFLVANKP